MIVAFAYKYSELFSYCRKLLVGTDEKYKLGLLIANLNNKKGSRQSFQVLLLIPCSFLQPAILSVKTGKNTQNQGSGEKLRHVNLSLNQSNGSNFCKSQNCCFRYLCISVSWINMLETTSLNPDVGKRI
jgi:hypothetical protein